MLHGDVQVAKRHIDQRAHLTQGQREELGKVAPIGDPWRNIILGWIIWGDFLSFFWVWECLILYHPTGDGIGWTIWYRVEVGWTALGRVSFWLAPKHRLAQCLSAAAVGVHCELLWARLIHFSCRVDTHRAWPKVVTNQSILKEGKRNMERWINGQIWMEFTY